jgi:hypothetical protein
VRIGQISGLMGQLGDPVLDWFPWFRA